MTNNLRDAMTDLVTAVPDHVVPSELAETAFASGRRRRIRRRLVGVGAVVATVAAVLGLVVPMVGDVQSLPPANSDDDVGVTSYPQRVGHQWWVRDIPDKPGPIAGLVRVDLQLHALAPSGHRWRVPADGVIDEEPAISADGRYISYISGDEGPYVIHDLVTGELVEFPQISRGLSFGGEPLTDTPFISYPQQPSFWSPDGSRVIIPASPREQNSDYERVVLGVDGSFTAITLEETRGSSWDGRRMTNWCSSIGTTASRRWMR